MNWDQKLVSDLSIPDVLALTWLKETGEAPTHQPETFFAISQESVFEQLTKKEFRVSTLRNIIMYDVHVFIKLVDIFNLQ